ncbi:MAG: TetR/AcrR family transcriptional regulator [Candidatus Entotheonellia bacterium]
MQSGTTDSTMLETRQRLLEAVGEVFAERGFRAATVRDICQRAKANIAAINYHFGDKERLYTAVLKYAFLCGLQKYPPLLDVDSHAGPEPRLRAFIPQSSSAAISNRCRTPNWFASAASPTSCLSAR